MNRRTFLRASVAATGAATLSGCLSGLFETRSVYEPPPLVENRPKAVYIPSHIEGMEMGGMATKKWYKAGIMFSFPHRFWTVDSQNKNKVNIRENDTIHLMSSVWDSETTIVPPNANLRVDVTKDGESIATKSLWPMLSQNMGYHFGDNIALSGDGTYTVTVHVGPLDVRRTGRLQEKYGEQASFSITFDYSQQQRDEIMFKQLSEKKGQKGAVDPMEMKMMPSTQLPQKDQLPGTLVGEATSGDGTFIVTKLDSSPAGIDKSGPYLAVSPRTPHNRYPLPFMSLSGTVKRGKQTIFDGPLTATLDPELNYHYGTSVERLQSGDTLALTVDVPPQVARHEGYEMAFFEMPPMELTL
ncbi:iron transporter [Halocatena marina]|uniref:iron transporter n=1 Tax=Halocatena marina TaxID=2934937 RepID=UPI00200D87AF|nr:iron transporter [Halocatena marina]